MSFDTSKHMIQFRGKDYLPVPARVAWMRSEHPDWGIVTEPLIPLEETLQNKYAVMRCSIFNGEGKLIATGIKQEHVKDFGDYVEKAETGAVGRALALCGYGTLQASELDEGTEKGEVVDSPQERSHERSSGTGAERLPARATAPTNHPANRQGYPSKPASNGSYGDKSGAPRTAFPANRSAPVPAGRPASTGQPGAFNHAAARQGTPYQRTTPDPVDVPDDPFALPGDPVYPDVNSEVFHSDMAEEAAEEESEQDIESAEFRRFLGDNGVTVADDEGERKAVNMLLKRDGGAAKYRPTAQEYRDARAMFATRLKKTAA